MALIRVASWPFGPHNRCFPPKTTRREKCPDWLAEEPVTSELLSRLEQGKIQGKLRMEGDFVRHTWPKPIHTSGVATKIRNQRPTPNKE